MKYFFIFLVLCQSALAGNVRIDEEDALILDSLSTLIQLEKENRVKRVGNMIDLYALGAVGFRVTRVTYDWDKCMASLSFNKNLYPSQPLEVSFYASPDSLRSGIFPKKCYEK